ncbi:MAG: Chemotaxis response regulator protein-glutamate methylesterase [bacterium]|nr:Chemotaxis response regulator protein-glutamate methylesterase [bacterium]
MDELVLGTNLDVVMIMVKILIVDDVQEYLDSLSRALTGEYEVITAASLEEAKQNANATIKLALVDVRLSEAEATNCDGVLFLQWLKQNFPKVPVIMMSAYSDFDAAINSLNLGASRYLRKPINLRELKELIKALTKEAES